MVKESSVQTTPIHSPTHFRRSTSESNGRGLPASSRDYRTYVNVYGTPDSVTEITQVKDTRQSSKVPVTVIDSVIDSSYEQVNTHRNRHSTPHYAKPQYEEVSVQEKW